MGRVFQPLLFLLARCTRNELIRQVEWLKAENEMLRKRVDKKRIFLEPEEKARLMKLGQGIGSDLKHLITIVSYNTFLSWLRIERGGHKPKKMGRPRTAESIRKVIVKIGSETGWGYTRIMGELKKLGLKPPSRNTVKRIMKAHDLDPGPNRGPDSWHEFLKRHAETLYQCDFFSKRVWTKFGPRQYFVLVFLHLGSRKVFVTKCTRKPTTEWMIEQAQRFVEHVKSTGQEATLLLRDRDSLYRQDFDKVLRGAGIKVKKNSVRAPNLQAHIERFIQSLQQEALDYFIACDPKHFDYLISEYVEYYHTERPHQGVGNVPLMGETNGQDGFTPDAVVCRTRLGGVLRHYERRAA
ncbi:Integrase core domain protein [Symmachiella dynata]|uniref:Integrase core domain protein n=1 Tax=Symmachiella dynata TaxID=2527995 RepID=A0A517ZQ55_9PLAN|nr:integrase core domain-containing protein [Symmachiella dynata]QDU44573.1 Integrase core domain protein [Symmachiella dynata]